MPPFEIMDRHQAAVLWSATGGYDDHGEPVVGEPTEIRVRWNWGRTQSVGPRGNIIALDAKVVAAEDIPLGSNMWQGSLEDWYGTGSAGEAADVMYVVTEGKAVDLKGRITRREYGLSWFRDNPLPTG